ncbi:hypothetical protein [Caldimonas tepidiphila]|uniref:hypothetical protein n=1 Tax=Caldimonas tepidiphila TaxID=2315841 RepID=UPI001300279A|nr:hypothetical protein [Caldimonas tepidiphila]
MTTSLKPGTGFSLGAVLRAGLAAVLLAGGGNVAADVRATGATGALGATGATGATGAGAASPSTPACTGPALPWAELAPGVWLVPGEGGEPAPGNGGRVANLVVVRQGARVWLLGSGPTPAAGAALACEVRRRLGRPVSDVVNPRAQPELVLGNAAFPGARLWAAEPVARAMRRHCPACVEALAQRIGPAGAALDERAVRLPQRLLRGSAGRLGPFDWRLLPRGGRSPTLVLRHRASGLWIAHGLLWAGAVPELRDAELAPLREGTRALLALVGPAGVVGEQGGPAGAAALREHLAYWEALDAKVRAAVERGALESAASDALALPEFAHLPHYAERHPLNVQRAWRQAEQAWLDDTPRR